MELLQLLVWWAALKQELGSSVGFLIFGSLHSPFAFKWTQTHVFRRTRVCLDELSHLPKGRQMQIWDRSKKETHRLNNLCCPKIWHRFNAVIGKLCGGERGGFELLYLTLYFFFTRLFLSLFMWTTEWNVLNVFQERLSEHCLSSLPVVGSHVAQTLLS